MHEADQAAPRDRPHGVQVEVGGRDRLAGRDALAAEPPQKPGQLCQPGLQLVRVAHGERTLGPGALQAEVRRAGELPDKLLPHLDDPLVRPRAAGLGGQQGPRVEQLLPARGEREGQLPRRVQDALGELRRPGLQAVEHRLPHPRHLGPDGEPAAGVPDDLVGAETVDLDPGRREAVRGLQPGPDPEVVRGAPAGQDQRQIGIVPAPVVIDQGDGPMGPIRVVPPVHLVEAVQDRQNPLPAEQLIGQGLGQSVLGVQLLDDESAEVRRRLLDVVPVREVEPDRHRVAGRAEHLTLPARLEQVEDQRGRQHGLAAPGRADDDQLTFPGFADVEIEHVLEAPGHHSVGVPEGDLVAPETQVRRLLALVHGVGRGRLVGRLALQDRPREADRLVPQFRVAFVGRAGSFAPSHPGRPYRPEKKGDQHQKRHDLRRSQHRLRDGRAEGEEREDRDHERADRDQPWQGERNHPQVGSLDVRGIVHIDQADRDAVLLQQPPGLRVADELGDRAHEHPAVRHIGALHHRAHQKAPGAVAQEDGGPGRSRPRFPPVLAGCRGHVDGLQPVSVRRQRTYVAVELFGIPRRGAVAGEVGERHALARVELPAAVAG